MRLETAPERAPVREGNILLLPRELASDSSPVYPGMTRFFRRELYDYNRRLLSILSTNAQRAYGNWMGMNTARQFYPAMIMDGKTAERLMQQIGSAPDVQDTLAGTCGVRPADMRSASGMLAHMRGRCCPISPAHDTDYHLLTEIEESGFPLSEIAVLILDRHFDANAPNGEISKSSFLTPLLTDPQGLAGAAVIGLPEEQAHEYVHGEILWAGKRMAIAELDDLGVTEASPFLQAQTFSNSFIRHVVMPASRGRLLLGERIVRADGSTDTTQLDRTLDQAFAMFAANGAKHVFVMVDVDCVDQVKEGITATEYNVNAGICGLGIQDFSLAVRDSQLAAILNTGKTFRPQVGDIPIETIEGIIRALPQVERRHQAQRNGLFSRANPSRQIIDDLLRDISDAAYLVQYPADHLPRSLSGRTILRTDKGGLGAKDVWHTIDRAGRFCRNTHRNFGIRLPTGVVVAGSVTEIYGHDLGGKTATFAIRTAQALQRQSSASEEIFTHEK